MVLSFWMLSMMVHVLTTTFETAEAFRRWYIVIRLTGVVVVVCLRRSLEFPGNFVMYLLSSARDWGDDYGDKNSNGNKWKVWQMRDFHGLLICIKLWSLKFRKYGSLKHFAVSVIGVTWGGGGSREENPPPQNFLYLRIIFFATELKRGK
jgi:hypothetical protein